MLVELNDKELKLVMGQRANRRMRKFSWVWTGIALALSAVIIATWVIGYTLPIAMQTVVLSLAGIVVVCAIIDGVMTDRVKKSLLKEIKAQKA